MGVINLLLVRVLEFTDPRIGGGLPRTQRNPPVCGGLTAVQTVKDMEPEEIRRNKQIFLSTKEFEMATNNEGNASKRVYNKNSRKHRELKKWLPWILVAIMGMALLAVFTGWKPIGTAAPTAVPTQAPVVETTEEPVVETIQCPNTTEEAKQLFGVDIQRIGTESCGWVWRGKPSSHIATCPSGYVCTWDIVNDITVVHLGINQTANIYAGTWRLINAYPVGDAVYDTCALYAKEKDFGQREIPSFEVRFQSVPGVGPQSCPEQ